MSRKMLAGILLVGGTALPPINVVVIVKIHNADINATKYARLLSNILLNLLFAVMSR